VVLMLSASALACGSDLSESQVREKLAPSMVTFRTELDLGGSGFLVENNYIVTAAHVLWPKLFADVIFDDGTEHIGVPVISYDHIADIAILGPIETSAPHLELTDENTDSRGSTVFTVGYPVFADPLSIYEGTVWFLDRWPNAQA
jgi:S1-C subfamily serine protease